jgi:hypothetical protein
MTQSDVSYEALDGEANQAEIIRWAVKQAVRLLPQVGVTRIWRSDGVGGLLIAERPGHLRAAALDCHRAFRELPAVKGQPPWESVAGPSSIQALDTLGVSFADLRADPMYAELVTAISHRLLTLDVVTEVTTEVIDLTRLRLVYGPSPLPRELPQTIPVSNQQHRGSIKLRLTPGWVRRRRVESQIRAEVWPTTK